MQQIARIVRGLHIESRERVVNWAAAQPWGEELKQVPVVDPRQLTLPVAP